MAYPLFPVSPTAGRRLDGKSSAAVPLSLEKYVERLKALKICEDTMNCSVACTEASPQPPDSQGQRFL